MSLENTLERIAVALETIAQGIGQPSAPQVEAKPTPAPAPQAAAPVPPPPPEPVAMPTPAPAPAPAPAPVNNAVPFSDAAGLNKYIMEVYKELGGEKGARIANVLTAIGVSNVKEIKPEQYPALYQGVEELRAS